MDAILTAVTTAAPQMGGVGFLMLVLVVLVRREVQSRELYTAELTRQQRAHDEELAEIRAELTASRQARREAEASIDAERQLRRKAEDAAAAAQYARWDPRAGT